jgi:YD repeat-containing protein
MESPPMYCLREARRDSVPPRLSLWTRLSEGLNSGTENKVVAIVSGNSLGLSLTSSATLGQRGTFGNAGQGSTNEQVFVNVSNGNLVVQDRDDILMDKGDNLVALRTYNSLGMTNSLEATGNTGLNDDDNQDRWSSGFFKTNGNLKITGTPGDVACKFVRIAPDGAQALYEWDGSAYKTTAGDGAHDTIALVGGNLVWTDGSTGRIETYRQPDGLLISAMDADQNQTTYTYVNGLISLITASSGDKLKFDYISGTSNLLSVTMTPAAGGNSKRIVYDYTNNKLTGVTVDFTPDITTDSNFYKTVYAYDANGLLRSMTQSDTTSLTFDYLNNKVSSITDGLGRVTTFTYTAATDTALAKTTVKDALNLVTTYEYDAAGQLKQVTAPPVGGASQVTKYDYNTAGDVIRITDAMNHVVEMLYDARGNQTDQRDSLGNTVRRSYNADNQLKTETAYSAADPDAIGTGASPGGALTTRYVYTTAKFGKLTQLRYVITGTGLVTEHKYSAATGLLQSTSQYLNASYSLGAMADDATPTLLEMDTWAANNVASGTQRTDFAYDARGQLSTRTAWAKVDASGLGVADGNQTVTSYTFDYAGLLVQTDAELTATDKETTKYDYDRLGRISVETRFLSTAPNDSLVTRYDYDAANNTVKTTAANGLVTTKVYDKAGRLMSVTQSDASNGFGTTKYSYDPGGRLVMIDYPGSTLASPVRSWVIYDDAGRKVGDVDADGSLTEYVYNANNQITRTTQYATAVDLTKLVDSAGAAKVPTLAMVKPAANAAADRSTWNIYDGVGRLFKTVDADGGVTETFYDAASRVVKTKAYATAVNTSLLVEPLSDVAVASDAVNDRVTRNFYNNDGRLVASLDGEGYLTEFAYNTRGLLGWRLQYAGVTGSALRADGSLTDLRNSIVAATHVDDRSTRYLYDTKGMLVGEVDAEYYLTAKTYDRAGNLSAETRYTNKLTAAAQSGLTVASTLESVIPAGSTSQQTTYKYDRLNRLTEKVNFQGVATQYAYDAAGNLTQTVAAVGSADQRTGTKRYDAMGRVTGELLGEASLRLTGGMTPAQINAVYAEYGVTYAYDVAGRRISMTDANGVKTLYFYNVDNQLTHTVNAYGEVTESQYDTLGQVKATVLYGNRLAAATLATLTGGLITPGASNTLTSAVTAMKNAGLDSLTAYAYTKAGRLAQVTDPLNYKQNYVYNTFGERKSTSRQINSTASVLHTFDYDRRGLLLLTTDDAGGMSVKTRSDYDAFGGAWKTTDPNLNVRYATFDRLGRARTAKDALGNVTTTEYDAFNRLASVKVNDGGLNLLTAYSYDDKAHIATVTSPEGVTVKTYFNDHGQVYIIVDGVGNQTRHTYDKDGNLKLTEKSMPGGAWLAVEQNIRDDGGRITQTTDANGVVTSFVFNTANRVYTRTVDSGTGKLNLVTTYTHNTRGQEVLVKDANNIYTKYDYDLLGQLKAKTVDPVAYNPTGLNLQTSYGYDGTSNLTWIKSPNGTVTSYSSDKLGRRVTEVVDSNDSTDLTKPRALKITRRWTYDAAGNVTGETNATCGAEQIANQADREFSADTGFWTKGAGWTIANGNASHSGATAAYLSRSGLTASRFYEVWFDVLAADGTNTVQVYDGTSSAMGPVITAPGSYKIGVICNSGTISLRGVGAVSIDNIGVKELSRPRYVYDGENRLVYTIDPQGQVEARAYDGAGRLTKVTQHAVPVTGLPWTPKISDVQAKLTPTDKTNDAEEYRVYDKDDRVVGVYTKVGTGKYSVVAYSYDKNNRIILRTALANTTATAGVLPAASPSDESLRTVYDSLGRVTHTIDGAGAVVYHKYDNNGNEIERIAFERTVTPTELESALPRAVVNPQRDVHSRNVYDAAGRLTWSMQAFTVDANGKSLGTVTERVYDRGNNIVAVKQYANAVAMDADPKSVALNAAADRITQYVYDKAGRCLYSVDALLGVVGYVYDADGRVVQATQYASRLPSTTAITESAIKSALATANVDNRVQRSVYDMAGRLVYSIDADGGITKNIYDADGRLTQSLAYAQRISTATLPTPATEKSIADLVGAGSANDRLTSRAYDVAGRLVYSVDAMGHVTKTEYDGIGRVSDTILYSLAISSSTPAVVGAIGAAVGTTPAITRKLHSTWDAGGRLASVTDPLDKTETYSYDGLGRKTSFTNKLGAVWTYEYNAAGRLVSEKSPQVERTTASVAGGAVTHQTGLVNIITKLDYDALGNLTARTEAFGLAESRTTQYQYDQLGRQVRVIYPPVGVYDAAGDDLAITGVDGLAARKDLPAKSLETTTKYNALGDAISSVDTAGNASYKIYDKLGRVGFEIDAMGYVTRYDRNTFGDATKLTRYATAYTGSVTDTATIADAITAVAQLAAHEYDRVLETVYDRLGRAVKITEPQTDVYEPGAAYSADEEQVTIQKSRVTEHTYNAYGELLETRVDSNVRTSRYWDRRGQERATVDAMGFVTARSYDAAGNLEYVTEFAEALAAKSWDALADLLPAVTPKPEDRKTKFTYDAAGQKKTETRVAVEVSGNTTVAQHTTASVALASQPILPTVTDGVQISGSTLIDGWIEPVKSVDGALLQWTVPTTAGYSSSVQWRRKTADNSGVWNNATPLITTAGSTQQFRLSSQMPPGEYEVKVLYLSYGAPTNKSKVVNVGISATSPQASITSQSGTPLSIVSRNGGQALQWAGPAANSGLTTSFKFRRPDSGAWETANVTTDSNGLQYVVLPSNFEAGSYEVSVEFNNAVSTIRQDVVTSFEYDAVGNQTIVRDAATAETVTTFDALGRVQSIQTPSSSGPAALTQFFRDAHGNATLQVARAQGAGTARSAAIAATDRAEVTHFDLMGHKVDSTNARGDATYFSYDAKGNLAKSWFAVEYGENDGKATSYQVNAYDKLGRVLSVTTPAAANIDGVTTGRTATRMVYNAFGEMIKRTVDGVDGLEYWDYNNAGQVWRTNADDGVDRIVVYDVLGRATLEVRNSGIAGDANVMDKTAAQAAQSTMGRRTVSKYDALGRMLEQKLPTRYEAEGGVSVSHTNVTASEVVSAASQYDASAKVVKWTSSNQAKLQWPSLADLGPGDVKVQLSYQTKFAWELSEVGDKYVLDLPHEPRSRTETQIFATGDAASGVTLKWEEKAGELVGGISKVTGLTVYKKDLLGNWQLVVDTNTWQTADNGATLTAEGRNFITVAAPPSPTTQVRLEYAIAGTDKWNDVAADKLIHFGDQLRFDSSTLSPGAYQYRVFVRPEREVNWIQTASGAVDLLRPLQANIGESPQTGSWAPGIYGWHTPSSDTIQTFRYRAAGNTGAWLTLPVTSLGNGYSGVDASLFAAGTYEYELEYSRANAIAPYAHGTGTFSKVDAIGIPHIAGVSFLGNSDGSATVSWPIPSFGTAVIHYRPHGLATDPWLDVPAGLITTDAQTGRQTAVIPVTTTPGNYDIELLYLQNNVAVQREVGMFTVYPVIITPAQLSLTTANEIPAYTDPQVGVPPVENLLFTANANGSYAFSWPATDAVPKLERKDPATGLWSDISARITASGGRQYANFTYTEYGVGSYDIRTTMLRNNAAVAFSAGTITTYADKDIAATLTNTTPAYTAPVGKFAASADGSWTLEWPAPPAGQQAVARFRPLGSTGAWTTLTNIATNGTVQKLTVGATELAAGNWEADLYYTCNGIRTAASLRTLTIKPATYAAPTAVDTTPVYRSTVPYSGAGPIPVSGPFWYLMSQDASDLSWSSPAPSLNWHSVLRFKKVGTSTWQTVPINVASDVSRYTIRPAQFAVGDWDVQLTYEDSANNIKKISTANMTVSSATSHNLVFTYLPVSGVTYAGTADGGWILEWDKVVGPTVELMSRKVGASYFSTSFTNRITDTGTGRQRAVFSAGELPAGAHELQLSYTYYAYLTGDYLTNGIRRQSLGTLTVGQPVAAAPTMTADSRPYVAVSSPDNVPPVPTTFKPNADGSWRIEWPTTAGVTRQQFLYLDPALNQWKDASASIVSNGAIQSLDVGDVWEAGAYQLDLSLFQNTTRVGHSTGTLITAEDAIPTTLVEAPSNYRPAVFHPAEHVHLEMQFTAKANGGYIMRWPNAPAGATSQAYFRTKNPPGQWWTAQNVTRTTADGYQEINIDPGMLAAGTYEVDIWYSDNATGRRLKEMQGDLVTRDPVYTAPTVEVKNEYTAAQYTVKADDKPVQRDDYKFTFLGTPIGLTAAATFAPTEEGDFQMKWAPPTGSATTTTTFRIRPLGTSVWSDLPYPITMYGGLQSVTIPRSAPPGAFELQLTVIQGGQTVISVASSLVVPLAANAINQTTTGLTNGAAYRLGQAIIVRTYDRWGNLLSQTDPRNNAWVTKYAYNANNQITRQTDALGNVTNIHYDKLGRQIAVRDAIGNVNEQVYDQAGHVVKEVRADNTAVTHTYDIFGDLRQTSLAFSNSLPAPTSFIDFEYDKLSHLTRTIYAATDVRQVSPQFALSNLNMVRTESTSTYDAAGRKKSEKNGAGETITYRNDLRGNVMATINGAITTRFASDAFGRKIAERDGNMVTATWRYNYFGRLFARTDIGGTTYTYNYDAATQQLKSQTSTAGQDITYRYDKSGRLDLIDDTGTLTKTSYVYDLAGNRVRERTAHAEKVNGVAGTWNTYQDNHMAYDEMGRLIWVADGRAVVDIEYDAVGNRKRIKTHVINGTAADDRQDADNYFFYDAMNRQVLANVDSVGNLGIDGHRITYDAAGNKASDSWLGAVVNASSGTMTAKLGMAKEVYGHDAQDRISTIQRDSQVIDERYYDAAGRLVQSGKANLDPNYLQAINGVNSKGSVLQGNGTEIRQNLYDGQGRLLMQHVRNATNTATKYILNYADADGLLSTEADGILNVDAAGNSLGYSVSTPDTYTQYKYEYERRDGYKEKFVRGLGASEGLTTETYDNNNNLTDVADSTQPSNNRHIVNDAAGRALYVNQNGHIQRQLIVNGEVMGRYGETVNLNEPKNNKQEPVFQNTADFGFGFTSSAGNTPMLADITHVASAGDTLESLAHSYYGDSGLWYRIADANGLAGNEQLRAGQVLKIPGTERNSNSANTFKPYEPGKVIGDTSPNVPMPEAGDGGCGGIGQILMIVVAVAVTIYTAGTAAGALSTTGAFGATAGTAGAITISGTTMTAAGWAAAGAIGGAAGSIASQAVGNAVGAVDGFSWKQVALSAIGGGISGGLGGWAPLGETNTVGNAIVRAAVGNAVGQGAGVVTGLQKSFDWRSVAASAVGAGVGQAVGPAIGDAFGKAFGQNAGSALGGRLATSLVAGTAAAVMRGGKVAIQQVATDAFGNALGSSIAEYSNSAPATQGVGPYSAADYRNGSDIQSDNYTPASEYGYRNGMDMQSDEAWDQRITRQIQGMKIPDYAEETAALNRRNAPARIAAASQSETRRELNRFASGAQLGQIAGAAGPTVAPARLSGLDAAKASIGIEKELASLLRTQPNSSKGWVERRNALNELNNRYQITMESGGLKPDPMLLTTMGFQGSIASYHSDGKVWPLVGSAVAAGVILGMEVGPNASTVSTWKGAGPIPGTFGVEPATGSVTGLKNYNPKTGAVEYIFDPDTSKFVVGRPKEWNGSPHETLARSVSADPSRVVGGMFRRDADGGILTNEFSGHYHQNWTPEVRQQFVDFMRSKGVPTNHRQGM